MKRLPIEARPNWLESLTSDGVLWSTTENGAYWNEAMKQPVYYEFTKAEQQELHNAATEIHKLSLEFLENFFENMAPDEQEKVWNLFRIPVFMRQYIKDSWDNDEWGFYGRFDFIMTSEGPKLLEYNADTPTILIESAISQWNWFSENKELGKFPEGSFQYNEVHEALVQHWKDFKSNRVNGISFTSTSQVDDFATISYLAETAVEAGHEVKVFDINEIKMSAMGQFYDLESKPLMNCFKLYPWEWLLEDEFGQAIPNSNTRFIEPAWKMMLSNKALLVALYYFYPECKYLVPAYASFDKDSMKKKHPNTNWWVAKPLLSREGSNVSIFDVSTETRVIETEGPYDDGGYIYQEYIKWVDYDDTYPMLGVWMVGDDAVGLGIREDDIVITQNNSRFIPHIVLDN